MNHMARAMDKWFQGKVGLVTGASLGIGYGIAEALVSSGCSVAVVGRSPEKMRSVADRLSPGGGSALAIGADVAQSADVSRMVSETLSAFGKLDFLVNSAGVRSFGLVQNVSLADWNEVIDVQLTGTFLSCQAATDALLDTGGRIVNMSSMFGYSGRANGASYATAKAGVVALTKVLASELAPRVLVNAIAPGPVETERFGAGMSEQEKGALRKERASSVLVGRLGTPLDIAWATLYLLGPGATWMTGQV